MGLLGDIGQIIVGGLAGGPVGAVMAFTAEHESGVVECVVDVARQVVEIGTDVYRAIPDWAFVAAGFPLTGLLKHEAQDEIIWLGQLGANIVIYKGLTWSLDGPIVASLKIAKGIVPVFVSVGSLIGKIGHRFMNDQEWEMAQYIFRGTLFNRREIVLTNLGGFGGRPFTFPSTVGTIFVNLGDKYVHDASIPEAPVLFHELTHVWQAKRDGLSDIFLYGARVDIPGQPNPYVFTPGSQWSDYNIEQQATAVEAWTRGATSSTAVGDSISFDLDARNKLAIASPVFRYINANIRRRDSHAETSVGSSARQLLKDGDHHSMKELNSRHPKIWWK